MKRLFAATLLAALGAAPALAEGQITIRVGYSPGGSYDTIARLVADHLGRFVEGAPAVVVSNEPGAGSKKLAKILQASGARDGSEIGVISSALALNPIFNPEDTDFDPTKVDYLAAMAHEASYCVASKASGITTLDQFLTGDYKVGATGKDSTTYVFPASIKAATGAKFDIVTGFEGGQEIDLAMERGELDVRCGIGLLSLMTGDYISRVTVFGEIAVEPAHEIEGPEFVLDRITDPATKEALKLVFSSNTIHHPFLLPPDVPAETVEALRAAFIAMVADPGFLADAEKRKIHLGFTSGADVEAKIESLLAMPDDVKALAQKLVQ